MKKMLFGGKTALVVFFALLQPISGATARLDPVIKIDGYKDLFRTGDVFIAGQPTLEEMRWLKSQDVTLVVNIRSEAENKEFASGAYNEEGMVRELGMAYVSIPVGDKESYSPKTVDKLAEAIKSNRGKLLLHCAGAGRATVLWMAYLVRFRGLALDDATALGKQMKFTFPLEDFLGTPVSLSAKEPQK